MPLFRLPARPVRRRLTLESLDARDLPNGTIVAALSASGVVTLTGDDNDNVATIKVTGSGVTITPDANTAVNQSPAGTAVTLNGAVKSVTANLAGSL